VDDVGAADLVVVASPTYKASYTGLLKLFLDRFAGGTGLRGLAVPLMLGAAPRHALAGEVHLRPLLAELGAAVPTPALFVLDHEHDRAEAYDAWLTRSRPLVSAFLASTTGAPA
ncbi:MAG: NADPH-dependent oxidoreductase, partial [Nocardioidaceae bacterium]|nr:NADPH-dependent oxidoreductase [Nocardioidaceae bacterium]